MPAILKLSEYLSKYTNFAVNFAANMPIIVSKNKMSLLKYAAKEGLTQKEDCMI